MKTLIEMFSCQPPVVFRTNTSHKPHLISQIYHIFKLNFWVKLAINRTYTVASLIAP